MMTIAALNNRDVCFVGIGLPSAACNLARLTHAPNLQLIYESGTLATQPNVLPLSIGDGELWETALTTVPVVEIFRQWLQGGRISVGFLSGAQVDRFGNLNSTVSGAHAPPKVRLPGSGGASEIATACGQVFIIMRHGSHSYINQLDFLTSLGHGRTGHERRALGVHTQGPTLLVSDVCTMRPDLETCEMLVTSFHPGITREQVVKNSGCHPSLANNVVEADPPTSAELEVLRDLRARTTRAHVAAGGS